MDIPRRLKHVLREMDLDASGATCDRKTHRFHPPTRAGSSQRRPKGVLDLSSVDQAGFEEGGCLCQGGVFHCVCLSRGKGILFLLSRIG